MDPNTRANAEANAAEVPDNNIQRRLDVHEAQFASLQTTLQAILARLDADPASSTVDPTGGCASSATGGSLLGAPPQPATNAPLASRTTLSLDVPHFSGTDPMGWIAKAEQYFDLHLTPEADKVGTAMVGLDGSALHWARWLRQTQPYITWDALKHEIVQRYELRYAGSTVERLCSVRQSTGLDAYIDEFVALVTHVPGLPPDHYLGFFMQGLLPAIRSRLRTHQPRTISEALSLARAVEADLFARPPTSTALPPSRPPPPPQGFGPRPPH